MRLRAGPALTLRLRAGFGVNAKADQVKGLEPRSAPPPAFLEHFEDLLGRVHRWALDSLYARS